MSKAVGIDLGTTNSVVAVLEGGDPTVIANSEGSRTTPSVVGFLADGEVVVGEVAKRQAITNPDRTIASVKRNIGTHWTVPIDAKDYTPQEISARILTKLKRDAEEFLGVPVTQAVITVPAYFDDAQRTATKEAGTIAGLEVLRVINEPTAAALAYGLDKTGVDQTILVFDLGGGTFDVSVLVIGDGVFEVKSTSGNTQLGGDDWDARIVEWVRAKFQTAEGIDLSNDAMAIQRIREAAEKAKVELSTLTDTTINLPFITADATGPKHLDVKLSRSTFEEITSDLVNACRLPVDQAITDAGLTPAQLDHIVLVGGSTRIPAIQELVRSVTGKDPHKGVNPDEVVALGAAIQAGVLKGEVQDVLLLDVTPLSIGMETKGGIMHRLIERNTTIPHTVSEVFTTAEDNQPSVEIHVLQGERDMAIYNKSLGRFGLIDLPMAARGVPKIEVIFDIDANGIVHVSATDLATGREQSMTITGQSSLSSDDIERMVKDARAHAADDARRRAEAEIRNQADGLVYHTERVLATQADNYLPSERTAISTALDELRTALAGKDTQPVIDAVDKLTQASHAATQRLYAGAESQASIQPGVIAPPPPASSSPPPPPSASSPPPFPSPPPPPASSQAPQGFPTGFVSASDSPPPPPSADDLPPIVIEPVGPLPPPPPPPA